MKSNQTGSVAVTVALILILLLSVMAFSMDTGYLYLKKNQYQNAVEAAAMAGAADLCGEDPIATARLIAEQNGIEDANDEEILQVIVGYYDENDVYSEDFSEYKDFEADPDPETPENESVVKTDGTCCQYNNAVMVRLEKAEKLLTGTLHASGSPVVVVRAAAAAYLKRYDIIAGENGLNVESGFSVGYPLFQDTTVHANGDIQFQGTETFMGNGSITATGTISNCTTGYTEGVPEVELKPLETVVEDLRNQAETEGTMIDATGWPISDCTDHGNWKDAPFGSYCRSSEFQAYIAFTPADHNGDTYFLSVSDENQGEGGATLRTITVEDYPNSQGQSALNFTFASNAPLLQFGMSKQVWWKCNLGGEGKDAAYFYVDGEIEYTPSYGSNTSFNYESHGVFFRCRQFAYRWGVRPEWEDDQKMRIVADEITIETKSQVISANPITNSLFGPPCPPGIIKLGVLVLRGE